MRKHIGLWSTAISIGLVLTRHQPSVIVGGTGLILISFIGGILLFDELVK